MVSPVKAPAHLEPRKFARPAAAHGNSALSKVVWTLPFLLATFCFWKAIPSSDSRSSSIAVAAVQSPNITGEYSQARRRTLLTRPIQDIQVGQRVLANNPQLAGQDVPHAVIDPENNRLVVLHQVKPDGQELTVETLVSLEALAATAEDRMSSDDGAAIEVTQQVGAPDDVSFSEALVGQTLDLNMPELGAQGPAEIVAVRDCPPIEPDDGSGRRLVTSLFRHAAANVVDLQTTGSPEPIGVTTNHPFWSEDRQAFIPAGELQNGETLRRADGTRVQVTRIDPRRGPPVPVFNFEVEGQHAYSVGVDGLFVHNSCAGDLIKLNARRGRLGETLAGIPKKPKKMIESLTGTAEGRFPDRETMRFIIEVKNRAEVRLTNQLRDFMEYAAQEGKTFILKTRKGARIDPAIQKYADDLGITIRIIDGLK